MSDVYLANGEVVPSECIEALDNFERVWPGATTPGARAAIVKEVLKAYHCRDMSGSS